VVAVMHLAESWRQQVAVLRKRGDERGATLMMGMIEELSDALSASGGEVVTLKEAARISTYSAGHLARMIRAGDVPNAGRPNSPKLRRADVPTKGGRGADEALRLDRTSGRKEQIARSIVTRAN
jgi:hypothetical protein